MLEVNIITPEKKVYTGGASIVVAKTIMGEIGVLSKHAYLITTVEPCVVKVKGENKIKKFAVGSGFLEANGYKASFMVDSAEESSDIDVERAKSARERALKTIRELVKKQADIKDAYMSLQRANARLKAVE